MRTYHIDLYQKDGVDMLSLLRWERGQRNYAFGWRSWSG